MIHRQALTIRCADNVPLGADIWALRGAAGPWVVINSATAVPASFYHPFASYLAEQGHTVVTYDYRGIGRSKNGSIRHSPHRWSDWGQLDFAAVIDRLSEIDPKRSIIIIGHSIGGFLPGMAENVSRVERMLTVGAQFGYWRDYAEWERKKLFLKWHVVQPLLTVLWGYFPSSKLGWGEDLPPKVALEWAEKSSIAEANVRPSLRHSFRDRYAAFSGYITALIIDDDPIGTEAAVRRGLGYYVSASAKIVRLSPQSLGSDAVGHFAAFRPRHSRFWEYAHGWLLGSSPATAKTPGSIPEPSLDA